MTVAVRDAATADAAAIAGLMTQVTSARRRTDAHAFYARAGFTDHCAQSGRFIKPPR